MSQRDHGISAADPASAPANHGATTYPAQSTGDRLRRIAQLAAIVGPAPGRFLYATGATAVYPDPEADDQPEHGLQQVAMNLAGGVSASLSGWS
jgi:hypothetical protein